MPTELHRQNTSAFRDFVILSAISIFVSVLVFVFGGFRAFQEWVRNRREWTEWHIHDYVFVLVILLFALAIFARRRWKELGREISERKQVEELLQESEEKFRAVAATAADAIVSMDSQGNITYLNEKAERLFGHDARDALGKPLTLLMPERFHDAHRRGFQRFLSTGEPAVIGKTVELAGRKKDGSEFPLELSLASWKRGEETLFTGIVRDITDRKQAERNLQEAHGKLSIALGEAEQHAREAIKLTELVDVLQSCDR